MGLDPTVTCDGCGARSSDQSLMCVATVSALVNNTPVTWFFGRACGCADKLVTCLTGAVFPNSPPVPVDQVFQSDSSSSTVTDRGEDQTGDQG